MTKYGDVKSSSSHSSYEKGEDAFKRHSKDKKSLRFKEEISESNPPSYKSTAFEKIANRERASPYGSDHHQTVRDELERLSGMRREEFEDSTPQERKDSEARYKARMRLEEENRRKFKEKRDKRNNASYFDN